MNSKIKIKVLIGLLALTWLWVGYHVAVQMPAMMKKAKESQG